MADITSANAVFVISVPLLLPVPQQLQGFSTDDIFDAEDYTPVETLMGLDGTLSGGFLYVKKPMTITLQADSQSNQFFDSWMNGMESQIASLPALGGITLTSIGKSFIMTTGFLTRYRPFPPAKKTLMPRTFQITWQTIVGSPVGISG